MKANEKIASPACRARFTSRQVGDHAEAHPDAYRRVSRAAADGGWAVGADHRRVVRGATGAGMGSGTHGGVSPRFVVVHPRRDRSAARWAGLFAIRARDDLRAAGDAGFVDRDAGGSV